MQPETQKWILQFKRKKTAIDLAFMNAEMVMVLVKMGRLERLLVPSCVAGGLHFLVVNVSNAMKVHIALRTTYEQCESRFTIKSKSILTIFIIKVSHLESSKNFK